MQREKNRLLINAAQPGEIRVALMEDEKLADLDIEYSGCEQKKSNIYKGKISRIEPSLEAAFIDYGAERHGFLPFKEIVPSYFKFKNRNDLQAIKNTLKVGQEIMVQIEKEERGNKGAALTTYITLPGSYLVLMPNNPGAGGISRRIEGEERRSMQERLSQLPVTEGMGLILRTAGVGRELDELQADFNLLLRQWDAIQAAFVARSAPFLIFQEGDLVTRSLRDYLRRDIDQIIIDDPSIYEKVKQYIEQIRPDFVSRINCYQKKTPLFLDYGLEDAVESAFKPEVRLPSGGTIVINRTEALVAIDINSGRSTRNTDIEETAIKTNLEAAKEIAHQLRVRDLGGLIVIDFIDMNSEENKRKVENCLREATKHDRARIQIGRISSFGLLEMSRQRLRHSLGKGNETLCPHCSGQGTIRSIESLSLSLIRSIEKEALKKSTIKIQVEVPVEIITYLINEKRGTLVKLEADYEVKLVLIPNPHWHSPQFKVTPISKNKLDTHRETSTHHSYELIEDYAQKSVTPVHYNATIPKSEEPAVKSMVLTGRKYKSKTKLSLLGRLFSLLTDLKKTKKIKDIDSIKDKTNHHIESTSKTPASSSNRRSVGSSTKTSNNNSEDLSHRTAPSSRSRNRRKRGNPTSRSGSGIQNPLTQTERYKNNQVKQQTTATLEKKTTNRSQNQRRSVARSIANSESRSTIVTAPDPDAATTIKTPSNPTTTLPEKQAISIIEVVECVKPSIVKEAKTIPVCVVAPTTPPTTISSLVESFEKKVLTSPPINTLKSHRSTIRRYGGEPKLRQRHFGHPKKEESQK